MKLLEYEAKAILQRYDVPIPRGQVLTADTSDVSYPLVVKSQVPIGGRGKAGGVEVEDNSQESFLRVVVGSSYMVDGD